MDELGENGKSPLNLIITITLIMKKIFSYLVPVAALAMLFAIITCGDSADTSEKEAPPAAQEEIPVSVVKPHPSTLAEPLTATGTVSSVSEARLSFKTGGIIEKMYVKEGDRAVKGQLLARLNLTEINAAVSQAREGLAKAQRDLQRVQNLYRDSVATQEQVQNATTALRLAQEQLSIAQFNQAYSEIKAPISGVILKKLMNEGEMAGPGTPVYVMHTAGAGDWIVKAGIADKDFVRLKPGDKALLVFDAYPDAGFSARVRQLPQSADPMTGLYPVEFSFTPGNKKFSYGMFATVKLDYPTTSSYLSVPIDAIIEGSGNNAFVFVAEGKKVRKTPVRIAFLREGEAIISAGLKADDNIVTRGSAYLTEASVIRIMQ